MQSIDLFLSRLQTEKYLIPQAIHFQCHSYSYWPCPGHDSHCCPLSPIPWNSGLLPNPCSEVTASKRRTLQVFFQKMALGIIPCLLSSSDRVQGTLSAPQTTPMPGVLLVPGKDTQSLCPTELTCARCSLHTSVFPLALPTC